MNFNLTDVQQEFVKLAKDFGEKKLAPTITERDHQGIFDRALVDEMLSLGLAALISKKNTAALNATY